VRQLEPRNRPPAAPTPPPSRREAGNEPKPAAAFLIRASGVQLRHPGSAPVHDLDTDNAVPSPDHDRNDLTSSTRPAVSDAAAEYLAHQQDSVIRARVTGAEHGCHEPTGRPAHAPPGKRHGLPDRRSSHRRTAFPATLVPGNHASHPAAHANARPTRRRTSSRNASPAWPSVAVRGKPAVTPTTRPPRSPSVMRPWTPQYSALQRYEVTHAGTSKTARLAPRIRS
jgi:hypothetical protein